MKKWIVILLVLQAIAAESYAAKFTNANPRTQEYFKIKSVRLVDLTEQYKDLPKVTERMLVPAEGGYVEKITDFASPLDRAEVIVDKVINIGTKVWTVLDKGRPVQNLDSVSASALPLNISHWSELERWNDPEEKVYGVIYENPYGMEVGRFVYRLSYLAGGSINGIGRYIGWAKIEPVQFNTMYLYTFNAKASVLEVWNKGTKENPIAGMKLTVDWEIKTILKKEVGSHSYIIDGLGNLTVSPGTLK